MKREALSQPADIARARLYGCDVPGWAQFVTVDRDGAVYAFAEEPLAHPLLGVWAADSLGSRMQRMQRIGTIGPMAGWWTDSLAKRVGDGESDMLWDRWALQQPKFAPRARRRGEASQAFWRVAFAIVVVAGAFVVADLLGLLP